MYSPALSMGAQAQFASLFPHLFKRLYPGSYDELKSDDVESCESVILYFDPSIKGSYVAQISVRKEANEWLL